MAYPSIPGRPAPLANWTSLGDAWHAALVQALADDPLIRADLTAAKASVQGLAASRVNAANPSFTGVVGGITKAMIGLPNVDNTSDAAKTLDGSQLTSGALAPERMPAGVAAIRLRVAGGEANPSATNWQPRPAGYPLVVALGAAPAPGDALADDLHIPTTVATAPTGPQPILLTDGSTIPVWSGSTSFDATQLIGAVTTTVTSQPTFDAYTSRLPASQLLAGFRQMAANACSLLYTSQAQVPYTHATLNLRFTNTTGLLAQASRQGSWIEFGPASIGASVTASYSTHETAHLFLHSPTTSTAQTVAVVEGIADWVLVQMGYHYAAAHRPADGGTAWDAGYDTTAFFLDYVEKVAGGGTPGFVRALNASLNTATWSPNVITSLNVQGKTVTQLWDDYKAWLNPAPTPLASGLAGTWELTLADEFNGTTVNPANWSRLRGTPGGLYDSPYNPAMDDSSWDAAYATVSDGLLRLRWDRVPSESYGITYPYTAGIVTSEGLKSFTPPVFIEARIWFTDTPGLWPAFWLDPVVGWPPEIDIAEFVPDDTPDGLYKPHFNYHWGTSTTHQQMGWQWYGVQGQTVAGAWHTYGLHWTASKLQVYFDGQPGPSYTGTGITSQQMYIILSTGVRKGYLPAAGEMRVDYVRAWTPAAGGQAAVWPEGSVNGRWLTEYDGYGTVQKTASGTVTMQPQWVAASTTSACLVSSTTTYSGDVTITARMRTLAQRPSGANTWETAWLYWGYRREAGAGQQGIPNPDAWTRFAYYLALKPNGWELGKLDQRTFTGSGGQRYLATGTTPTYPVGTTWRNVKITMTGGTIRAEVDGTVLATFTDGPGSGGLPGWQTGEAVYTSGSVCLYCEDSSVEFADVVVTPAGQAAQTWLP